MKIINKHDLPAGVYDSDDAGISITTGGDGEAVIALDLTVVQPDPPPVDTDPPPPVDTDPPPPVDTDPPPPTGPTPITSNFKFDPPMVSPAGMGPNEVKITVDPHDGHKLVAIAHVGDDAATKPVYCAFGNEDGVPSDMLTLHAYADGCHVAVVRLDTATDMTDCAMTVEYNGVQVFQSDSVNFPLGQWNNFIRYGAPLTWKSVERHPCLPNFAWGESQKLYSEAGADYSFNGFGIDKEASVATTGERGALGYPPQWDMSFVLRPNADAWAVVQRVADTCYGRQTVRCHPTTGEIIDIDQYPGITTFPPAQNSKAATNPVPNYQGTWIRGVFQKSTDAWQSGWKARGSDTAHVTHFCVVAALATESAHYWDALAFQANMPLLNMNPAYRKANLLYQQQVRSLAWGMGYLFPASQVGRFTDYFKRQMEKQRLIIQSKPTNPMFMYAFTHPYTSDKMPGWSGGAKWMEDYVQLVFDPIGFVMPEWHDVCYYHAQCRAVDFVRNGKLRPACINCTEYTRLNVDPTGRFVDVDASDIATLQGAGWPFADASMFVATNDVAEAVTLYTKNRGYDGKVSASGMPDMPRTAASPDSYTSQMKMALASAVNYKVPGWEVCKQWLDEHPTNPDYSGNQKYHVVYR